MSKSIFRFFVFVSFLAVTLGGMAFPVLMDDAKAQHLPVLSFQALFPGPLPITSTQVATGTLMSAPEAQITEQSPELIAIIPGESTYNLYLPLIEQASSFVNLQNRQASLDLYLQQYLPSEGVPIDWIGSHSGCIAGNPGLQFRNAVLRRINYFRAMAGLFPVTLNDEYNRKAQEAALMMSVNRKLSHSPTSDWLCHSSDGAQAAGRSNLALGLMGWKAIDAYILEGGSLGHRRWILYPQTKEMGTGDIPGFQNYLASNALWVLGSNTWGPRPDTRDGFVAWPPPGYVPFQVVNDHWSFSYPHADFSEAEVVMTSGGVNIAVQLESTVTGYGENTLVWIPFGLTSGSAWPKPAADITYTIEVKDVIIDQRDTTFTYEVIVFNPTA